MRSVEFEGKNVTPCKIVCIGRNYVEHIYELNNEIPDEPVYFIKPNSAISKRIRYQPGLHYEAELAFLIKDKKIAGVGFGLDLTLRDVQTKLKSKGLPWERAKAFKGSALFSEFVSIESVENLGIELYKNEKLVQKGDISLMIYKPDFLIQDIDRIFGLDDYDIIMSGTPKGVGPIDPKEELEGRVVHAGNILIQKRWSIS